MPPTRSMTTKTDHTYAVMLHMTAHLTTHMKLAEEFAFRTNTSAVMKRFRHLKAKLAIKHTNHNYHTLDFVILREQISDIWNTTYQECFRIWTPKSLFGLWHDSIMSSLKCPDCLVDKTSHYWVEVGGYPTYLISASAYNELKPGPFVLFSARVLGIKVVIQAV
jgi:ubiquitin C-terminal hydrolase